MSNMESQMMDFDSDDIMNEMLESRYPLNVQRSQLSFPTLHHPDNISEDEFFKDLPIKSAGEANKKLKDSEPSTKRAYSNTSSVVDNNGNRVESTRRRYEDSNGEQFGIKPMKKMKEPMKKFARPVRKMSLKNCGVIN